MARCFDASLTYVGMGGKEGEGVASGLLAGMCQPRHTSDMEPQTYEKGLARKQRQAYHVLTSYQYCS